MDGLEDQGDGGVVPAEPQGQQEVRGRGDGRGGGGMPERGLALKADTSGYRNQPTAGRLRLLLVRGREDGGERVCVSERFEASTQSTTPYMVLLSTTAPYGSVGHARVGGRDVSP